MGGKNGKVALDETLFNLRFASKQMEKESQRAEREEKKEKDKVRRALEKGMVDNARIYGENAIRKHNDALNYLRLASKLDAVHSKINSATRTQELTKQFGHMVPQLNNVLKGMDVNKISSTMDQFEKVFDDLDVVSGTINQSLNSATSVSAPISQVDQLLGQIAGEHNIEVQGQLGEVPLTTPVARQYNQEDEMKRAMERQHY